MLSSSCSHAEVSLGKKLNAELLLVVRFVPSVVVQCVSVRMTETTYEEQYFQKLSTKWERTVMVAFSESP